MRTREPEATEDFDLYNIDNIKVYLFKEANVGEKVTIKMSEQTSDLPDKEIAVEGIDLSR